MKDSYKKITNYAFAEHTDAFKALVDVFKSFGIAYFLIGAQARDVHFFQKGIKPMRGTRDIDFAVMVDSMDHYNSLINALLEKGFDKTIDPYRLTWKAEKTVIDLLPFGQIEQDYTVNFDQRNIEISVLGYSEVYNEIEEYNLSEDGNFVVPVPPLHGLFLLKLLSWNNKKPAREKDLKDLNQILDNYWDFVDEEAFERHTDLFTDEFRIEMASARIQGRKLRHTLDQSEDLKQSVLGILKEQVAENPTRGLLLQKFAEFRDKPIDEIRKILIEIINGIEDNEPENPSD